MKKEMLKKVKDIVLGIALIFYGYSAFTQAIVMGAGGGVWVDGKKAVLFGLCAIVFGLSIFIEAFSPILYWNSKVVKLGFKVAGRTSLIICCFILLHEFFK